MSKHFKPFLGILALVFLSSFCSSENVSANSTKLSLKIKPVLETSVNYEPITIEADGNLNISDVALRVSSNNRTGFKTFMSTIYNSSEENATALKYEDIDVIETLSEDNITAEDFTMNKWGYSVDNGSTFNSFKAKDLTPSEVLATESAADSGNKNIKVGIKVNDNIISGNYVNTLLFTTVPNYVPISLADIETMQEMTSDVIANTVEHETKQLQDVRDGKYYWVTKLADGNIWMTQNLDLDLSTTTTLTPADSDVTANWTPSRATIAGAANISSFTNDYNTPYSFDPGNYYFDGTYFSSATCNYLTTTCDHFATTPYTLNGEHGHIGNYYNWSAVVASNDTSAITTEGTDMSSSICPKGWRLPHGYQSAQDNDFATLTTAYGGATDSDSVLLANPLFFVRGGLVNSGGSSHDSANFGRYWSSTAHSATSADSLRFNSGSVSPSYSFYRYDGASVRCLAHKQTQTLTIKDQSDDSVIATYDFETSYKLPEAPAKEGYNFLGYDENKTTTTPTYHPGDLIDQSKTIYAIYEKIYPLMQDVSSWKNTLTLEQQIQVKDARDNKIYWVSKLKDGNIWMTQNLDLDLSTTTTLTPADSDVTANWTPSSTTIAGAANLNSTNWANNNNNPYSFDPGNYYFDGTYYSSSDCNYLTTTCDHFATTPYTLNGEHGHIGNYYNWSAAVASNDTSATTAAGTDMSSSICPKGWRLPHGYQSTQGNDFATLNTAYGGATNSDSVLLANPLFFVRGGVVYSRSLSGSAYYGNYSSSTASSAAYAGNLYFYSGVVIPSSHDYRRSGLSVRCLAR